MIFSDYKDIYDFYQRTGMTREETFNFLLKELNKERQGKEHEPRSTLTT